MKLRIIFKRIDRLTVFLCMIWGSDLLNYANAIFLRLPVLKEIGEYASSIIVVMALLLCFRSISKYITKAGVVFFVFWLLAYLLSYSHTNNTKFLDNSIGPFFLTVLPLIFVGRAIDIDKLSKPFYYVSLIYIAWKFFVLLFFKSAEREMGEFSDYNMFAAYKLLPHLIMVTWHLFRKVNVVDACASVIGFVLLFGFGTRGPILCWIIFIALYFLLVKQYKRKIISMILIAGVAITTLTYVSFMFDTLNDSTRALGLSNRVYMQMDQGALNDDSGRSYIHKSILDATKESGILGMGICGDRAVTGDDYSHNLFIELIASFGYVFGSVLIIALLLYLFFAYRSCVTQEQKGFYILLLCFNAHLLLSSTFLQTPLFFLFIGWCGRLINDKNNSKNNLYGQGNQNCRITYVS